MSEHVLCVIVVLYVNACWVDINIYIVKFYYLTASSCLHFSYTIEMVVCICMCVCTCAFASIHAYTHWRVCI